jgi:branched-chain amino acid transport system ATP-binding protein
MLTIARTLAGGPALLLVDEPTEGLSPVMVKALEAVIRELKRQGQTMIVAAQDLRFALAIADEVLVMDRGRIVHQAAGDAARSDSARVRALFQL